MDHIFVFLSTKKTCDMISNMQWILSKLDTIRASSSVCLKKAVHFRENSAWEKKSEIRLRPANHVCLGVVSGLQGYLYIFRIFISETINIHYTVIIDYASSVTEKCSGRGFNQLKGLGENYAKWLFWHEIKIAPN